MKEAGIKYSCKICYKRIEHSRPAIKVHLRNNHNTEIEEYENKYVLPSKEVEVNQSENPKEKDLLGEVLNETLNELCEPEEDLAAKETKKRKLSGNFQKNSKHLKLLENIVKNTGYKMKNTEIESQIEFSDSSDDED